MKKLSFLFCLMAITLSSFAADVNEEVLKIFTRSYPSAQNITWSPQKPGYQVYFTTKEASYRVTYDLEGNYPDFKIHSVIEKSSENELEYHIIIQGAKKLITLKSDSIGNFEVESKYDSQND